MKLIMCHRSSLELQFYLIWCEGTTVIARLEIGKKRGVMIAKVRRKCGGSEKEGCFSDASSVRGI